MSVFAYEDDSLKDIQHFEQDLIMLPSGQALTAYETYPITASEKNNFVVVMGVTGSGKTTLISAIYQMFLLPNKIKNFYFAGSKTLSAFEERSFYSRTTSYGEQAETLRTPRGFNNNILHIRLLKKESSMISNILLADISGEEYESVIANTQAAKENFSLVKAAKSIVLLLDGGNLVRQLERFATVQQAIHILRTFSDSALIRKNANIIITISKYDLIEAAADVSILEYINTIVKIISSQIPDIANKLMLIKTAAMPQNETVVSIGYGIESLLENLTKEKMPTSTPESSYKTTSQFDLWEIRRNV